jgi:DNA polymerase-4
MNINTIGELAHTDYKKLVKVFKEQQAEYLRNASWGIDNSEVNEANYHKNNSISTTETLPRDTDDEDKLKEQLLLQTERVTRELREKNKYTNTIAVIYKDRNFNSYSAQEKLSNPTNDTKEIYKNVKFLKDNAFDIHESVMFTYNANNKKNIKLDYLQDIRDTIKDIYKHI